MLYERFVHTAQKLKFSIKDFFSKCDLIRSFLRIWLLLLKKSLMVNFAQCQMNVTPYQTIDAECYERTVGYLKKKVLAFT